MVTVVGWVAGCCFKLGLLGLFGWLGVGVVDATIQVMCCVNSVVVCALIGVV